MSSIKPITSIFLNSNSFYEKNRWHELQEYRNMLKQYSYKNNEHKDEEIKNSYEEQQQR